jgi:4-hydroxy-2-oxoheptanedioate aldolase
MNRFLERLRAPGPASAGIWMNLAADPVAAEITLSSGFDWVLLDGEHSPAGLDDFLRVLQIAGGYDPDVLIRPAHGDPVVIKRLLDIGARNLLIPMVDTAEQADMLAASMSFPPDGIRGVSSQTRGGDWGRRPGYLAGAREDLCLIVQIESPAGAANCADIFAVGGVDAAFVGAADLAANLGHPGQPTHPDVIRAMDRVIDEAARAGVPLGALTRDPAEARRLAGRGLAFIGVGTDTSLFSGALAALKKTAQFS